jgi:glycosyltransferase involved in cell wall biosynthesis
MVVNEAMACGMAICASDQVGSAYDLVRDNGAMFPVGDIGALADRMARWAADPHEVARMKSTSTKRIGEWGPRQTADAIVRAVHAALNGTSRP